MLSRYEKHVRETSRTRESGCIVVNTSEHADPGQARIDALRRIVTERDMGKIDGYTVDLFTASAVVQVYDALKPENQVKMRSLAIYRMVDITWKLVKKQNA